MNCPQCGQTLSTTEVITTDEQKAQIHECFNCGGHFLPSLISNFISPSAANSLDSILPKDTSPLSLSHIYKCPICQQAMTTVIDDAVPKNVTVISCPSSHGNFFPQGQLSAFKKAQRAKLSYHQIWGIPLKSAFAILLPIVVLFAAVSVIPVTLKEIQKRQESRVAASPLISQPIVTPISSREVLISFTSQAPLTSQVTITNLVTNQTQTLPITVSDQTTHIISLPNLSPQTQYRYFLILKAPDKKAINTPDYSFTTSGN